MDCPADLVYNSNTHRCDHSENVPSCQNVAKSSVNGHIIASASLVEAVEAEINPLQTRESGLLRHKFVCYYHFGCVWVPDWFPGKPHPTFAPVTTEAPFECTSAGLFPDRHDCSKFIICQDAGDGFFIEHDMDCPADLVYNSNTHRCDHSENVPSCQNVAKSSVNGHIIASASLVEAVEAEINPLQTRESGLLRHKFVCYYHFGCVWVPDWFPGKPHPTFAPVTTEAPFECTSAGLFPDRDDCSKFIICQDAGDGFFIEHDMDCPADLVYNSNTHRCDHSENVPSCQA